ncbi:hypothetical protein CDD81_5326 [Ophiocordyceps australis]|uniref:Pheromone-regulated membrane protein n=1 Tax=Ophiocordyceps australis TaxID=1399860 RepID=A0A2C5XII8_9HYPO|nr:hypothetical protein CDD81_5326 [Ophiocordyceps australis]
MGCLSHRRKQTSNFTDQKWDYINLADFKAKGCGPGFFYGYLWFCLFISIAVYAVDSFTAVNLLAFNRWSSKIEPAIPLNVSKWIFSGCIIASFVNLGFEGIRAARVMRRGNVAECYMDSLAARWESIRIFGGQGWRRFLVFTELTKSKKGAEYVALFTYFSFQSWIRVILCSGPRQVVNAFTLKSVYQAKLATTSDSVGGSITGFFDKIKELATEDYQQAAILSGMCFTLVVWVFSALFLLMAVLFYVFFLFHWVPRSDGGLTGYCERKVNKRLTRIVTTKVNKALAKGQMKRARADAMEKGALERAATLPTLPNMGDAKGPFDTPSLGRSDTGGTYPSRPSTPGSIELGYMDQKRPFYYGDSASSIAASNHSARMPLAAAGAEMGHGYGRRSPDYGYPEYPDYARPATAQSQRSLGSRTGFGRPQPSSRAYEGYGPDGTAVAPATMGAYRGDAASVVSQSSAGVRLQPQPQRILTASPLLRGTPYPAQRNMTPAPAGRGPLAPEPYEEVYETQVQRFI